jgi:hypothetical protein
MKFSHGSSIAAALTIWLSLFGAAVAAGSPERDKAWNAWIEQAKAHGGVETVLESSASFVFQRPDGVYVTFTRLLKSAKRSVCLIAKDQHATICMDWDTGKASYGSRPDAATPWTVHGGPSPEEVAAEQPGLLDEMLSMFAPKGGGGAGGRRHSGYSTHRDGNPVWVNPN